MSRLTSIMFKAVQQAWRGTELSIKGQAGRQLPAAGLLSQARCIAQYMAGGHTCSRWASWEALLPTDIWLLKTTLAASGCWASS